MLRKSILLPTLAVSFAFLPSTAYAAILSQTTSDPNPSAQLMTSEKSFVSVLQPNNHPLYRVFTQKFIEQGRFNYLSIGYNNDTQPISAKEFIAQFQAYLKANAGRLAAKDKADFKFKDIVITGDDLDRMLTSAYVILPLWTYSPVTFGEEKTHADEDGATTTSIEAKSTLTLAAEVINVQTGAVIGELAGSNQVSKTISMKVRKDAGRREFQQKLAAYEMEKNRAATSPASLTFDGESRIAADSILTTVMTDVRRLEAFRLKTFFTQDRENALSVKVGSSLGVVHDSVFNVVRKVKSSNGDTLQNVGFIKIRDINNNDSGYQVIQDQVGFEQGDQLIEHPQSGRLTGIRLGVVSFDPSGSNTTFAPTPALSIVGENDLAPLTKMNALSEVYGTADFNLMAQSLNKLGLHALLGLKKQLYFNQWVLSAGLKGGLLLGMTGVGDTVAGQRATNGDTISTGSSINVINLGLGAGPAIGIGYQINPDMLLGINAAYLLGTPLVPYKVSVTDRQDTSRTYDFSPSALPPSMRVPNGSSSGLSLNISGTYSF